MDYYLPSSSSAIPSSSPRLTQHQRQSSLTVYSEGQDNPSQEFHIPEESDSAAEHDSSASIVAKIEDILEDIVDALGENRVLTIPMRNRSSGNEVTISFPANTSTGARRFTALLQVLYLCHEALITGNIITKRNIYYQNPSLFGNQAYVDHLVDDIAFTFGVGRDFLNIVAASKGLITGGPFDPGQDNHGVPIPQTRNLDDTDLRSVRWILVIEKEATFRSLAATRYFEISAAGPGIIVTAKGYPDLATRQFLHSVHSACPRIPIQALVDFDPDGIAIMRIFKLGSKGLDHEGNATIPGLVWLGVKSSDVFEGLRRPSSPSVGAPQSSSQQGPIQHRMAASSSSQVSSSQASSSLRWDAITPTRLAQVDRHVIPLSANDRRKAVNLLRTLKDQHVQDAEEIDLTRELQLMLMLSSKFEIQAVGEAGNMTEWLDQRLSSNYGWNLQ
ncbi:Spo11/DNA topoisomerase VI subunit A [Xylariales sp. AK1849]|nr:Spo11/DNA topoisomerase VI subunit A [Xylariales sp. AK1849]